MYLAACLQKMAREMPAHEPRRPGNQNLAHEVKYTADFTARRTHNQKNLTAENAKIAEVESILFVFSAFLCGKNLRSLGIFLCLAAQIHTDSEGRTPVLLRFALSLCPVKRFSSWKSSVWFSPICVHRWLYWVATAKEFHQ